MANEDASQNTPFTVHQRLLRERFIPFLQALHPLLQRDVRRALSERGKLLAPDGPNVHGKPSSARPSGAWSLLTLLVALHIDANTDLTRACNAALALECFICALDLLDDIEDEDQTPIVRELGPACVLNTSTTLLMLAQRILLALPTTTTASTLILSLLDTLQDAALRATAGQHRDLLAEQRAANDMTQEECIEIATGKAGALMELACRMGTLCAGADQHMSKLFSHLGLLLGIAHQLDNDSHDLYDSLQFQGSAIIKEETETVAGSIKSDLLRGKKTLPVVLAAQSSSSSSRKERTEEEYRQALHEGIITTWGISLLYRERASSCLQEIEAHRPVAASLRLLLGFA